MRFVFPDIPDTRYGILFLVFPHCDLRVHFFHKVKNDRHHDEERGAADGECRDAGNAFHNEREPDLDFVGKRGIEGEASLLLSRYINCLLAKTKLSSRLSHNDKGYQPRPGTQTVMRLQDNPLLRRLQEIMQEREFDRYLKPQDLFTAAAEFNQAIPA